MSKKMRFATISTIGTHTIHYFDTLKEAREYAERSGISGWLVVRIFGRTETEYVPEGEESRKSERATIKRVVTELGVMLAQTNPGFEYPISALLEELNNE